MAVLGHGWKSGLGMEVRAFEGSLGHGRRSGSGTGPQGLGMLVRTTLKVWTLKREWILGFMPEPGYEGHAPDVGLSLGWRS